MKKVKVLHIITHLPIGGAQDNTLITVEKMSKEIFDVSLMCGPGGEWVERALSIKGVRIIFIKELIRKIHFIYDLIVLAKIYSIMRKEKFIIVHTHSSKPGFAGRIAAKLAGVPIVIHTIHGFPFHDFMHPIVRKFFIFIERVLSKFSDRLITVSLLNREKAIHLKLAQPEKFINIYSGISFEKFQKSVDHYEKKKELGILQGEKIVGMVGRLSKQKAPQYFIQAMPSVLKRVTNVRFLIVGDGELKSKVIRLSNKLGVREKVTFLGFREDIPEILEILDVFVLPSLWEGLGRSLTEAMVMGCPVVATRVEGVPELVVEGETGILVQPKDTDGLAGGIVEFITDSDKAGKMGQAAREKVLHDFSAEQMVNRIEKLYWKMIRERVT